MGSTLRTLLLTVVTAVVLGGSHRLQAAASPPAIELKVRVKLSGGAALKPADVKFALFPSGKRCAFTYNGCRDPKTIAALSKLGFRTTVHCSPATPAERLKALEDAGTDIGIEVWGAKGTYASNLGGNSIQEAFDACATSRLALKKNCRGPLGATAIGGHYAAQHYLVGRNPDKGDGFGYAYHDSNYLIFSDNKAYPVLLAREGEKQITLRRNFDNTMHWQSVPNETIYYQIVANQFAGTLRRAEKGQVVRFTLRDFKAPDLEELAETIGKYGEHPQIWNASEMMIGANEYLRAKARMADAKTEGEETIITLALDRDVFPPFLVTPLPLLLPKTVEVVSAAAAGVSCPVVKTAEGPCIDVPVRAALAGGCTMTVDPAAPDMTIPDEMRMTLTVRNTSERPLAIAKFEWIGNIGFTVSGGESPFELPAKGERKLQAVAKTTGAARFGLTPLGALLTTADGRTLCEGFELAVAPRLRVEVDPMQSIPLPKGRSQYFFVHLANGKTGRGGLADKFISHKAGPCKGTIAWDLPSGMKAVPAEQPFELAEDDAKTLVFRIDNEQYSSTAGEMVKPIVRIDGEKERLAVLFPGTVVIRNEERVGPRQLDDKGLLFAASWDDNSLNGRADRACGNPRAYFYPGHHAAYSNEGAKGWCMNSQQVCEILDSYRNIDYYEGTVCFYVRKDPLVRNENTFVPDPMETVRLPCGRSNHGETLFTAGLVQNAGSSNSGITLRRFRSWQGKDGYLQLTYQMMGGRLVACQAAPFPWSEEWRHVAILWGVKQKRLEIYLDGKLAAKANPGQEEWRPSPWDRGVGNGNGWNMNLITSDHGAWCGTCRDEVYIYNRALTAEETRVNKELAK